MAAFSRPVVCQQRINRMTTKPGTISTAVAGQRRLPPVRVKLYRGMPAWQKSTHLTASMRTGGDG